MKIALVGYGKMGHETETIARLEKHDIVAVMDNELDWTSKLPAFRTADAAIDFSTPSAVTDNIKLAFENHVPIVVGTTGWYDRLPDILSLSKQYDGSLVYGSNFSIGANLFMRVNELLATWMNTQPQYAPRVEETHHVTKKDAPSGTAIHLAEDIVKQVDRITDWQLTDTPENNRILPVKANRTGTVPGIHRIVWHAAEDDIELLHVAHSRQGFARGAVKAAVWLHRHPGIYEFKDIALYINT